MESQEVLASLAVTQTDITMPRFLSLPVELIERVGEQVISRQQAAGWTQNMVQSRQHMQALMENATARFSCNMGYGQ